MLKACGVDAHYGNKHIVIGRKMMENEISKEVNQLMSTVESEGKTAIPVALDKSVIVRNNIVKR